MMLCILSLLCAMSINAQIDTCVANSEIAISFPPIQNEAERDFAKVHLDSLGIKRIRFGERWSFREPSPGEFNWAPLDDRISWASENGYEILLTVQSNGPDWACGLQNNQSCVFNDNNDFKNYIDALLIRHADKIDKIQFGNEWQSYFWYIGSAQEFIDANNILYQSVQEHSPETEVVLGGFTAISLRFLAGCNGSVDSFYDDEGVFYDSTFLAENCSAPDIVEIMNRIDSVMQYASYDIVDIHLYDDVEQWDEYYENFSDTITKPIIVSEFGGPNMNLEPYTPEYQAGRLVEYIQKLDSLGIPEIYYFKLVEGTNNPAHSTSGLIDGTTLLTKPAYSIIKEYEECTPVAVRTTSDTEIMYYPNPAQGRITLVLDNASYDSATLNIFSADGLLVYTESDIQHGSFTLKTDIFRSGLYFIQLQTSSQIVGHGKLIIH